MTLSNQDVGETFCQHLGYNIDYINYMFINNWSSERGFSTPRLNLNDNSQDCGSFARAIFANAQVEKGDMKMPDLSQLDHGKKILENLKKEKMKYAVSKNGNDLKLLARSSTRAELSAKLLKLEQEGDYQFFYKMIQDLATVSKINDLSQQAVNNLTVITEAAKASLFLICSEDDDGLVTKKKFYIKTAEIVKDRHALSKLLSIRGQGSQDDTEKNWTEKICEYVASTGNVVNLGIPQEDTRFHEIVDGVTKHQTYSLLSLPVMNLNDEIIAVAQMMNKTGTGRCACFTKVDEEVCKMYLEFFGIFLFNFLTKVTSRSNSI